MGSLRKGPWLARGRCTGSRKAQKEALNGVTKTGFRVTSVLLAFCLSEPQFSVPKIERQSLQIQRFLLYRFGFGGSNEKKRCVCECLSQNEDKIQRVDRGAANIKSLCHPSSQTLAMLPNPKCLPPIPHFARKLYEPGRLELQPASSSLSLFCFKTHYSILSFQFKIVRTCHSSQPFLNLIPVL